MPKRIFACSVHKALSVVVLLALGLSGCTLKRVFNTQAQLCNFDENFSYSLEGRPQLVFSNPVLHETDLDWVLGDTPTSQTRHAAGYTQRYVFEKLSEKEVGKQTYTIDLHYQESAAGGLLQTVQFPPEMPAIEKLGIINPHEEIRRSAQELCDLKLGFRLPSMRSEISRSQLANLPSRDRLYELLGPPSYGGEGQAPLVYNYALVGAEEAEPVLSMSIWFDEDGSQPLRMESRYRDFRTEADLVSGQLRHRYL